MNYQTVPALLPATFSPATQVEVFDIDGDRTSEVVVLNPDAGQLAVIHQFTFNDLSSSYWPDATTPQWWCEWTTPPAPAPAPGGGTWNVQPGDVMVAGDFDGDGTLELFLYNTTTLAWAVLKWQASTNGLATLYTGRGCPGWKAQTGDTFHLFPGPNGAAADGLLAFNTVTLTIGVLQFESGKMSCPIATTGGDIENWTFHANDEFYAGHFTSPSTGGFMVFNPGDTNIAYLTWTGSAITVSQGQNGTLGTAPGGSGQWFIRWNDQYQCLDLDGDGLDEVFAYNGTDPLFVGAWKWVTSASQFQCLIAAKDIPNWTIGANDQYTPVPIQKSDGILAFNSALAQVAVLQYVQPKGSSGAAFQSSAAAGSLNAPETWFVSANDVYYSAPTWSTTAPNLFVISPQPPAPKDDPVSTLGALSTDGSTISVVSQVILPAPGWTATLLSNAPATTIPTFSTSQLAVYVYISNQFNPSTQGDIRGSYNNSSWASLLGSFGQSLMTAKNPTGQGFSEEDWDYVSQMIGAECQGVEAVNTTYTVTMPIIERTVAGWQSDDVNAAKNYIQLSLPAGYGQPPASIPYWPSQFAVAAVWGIAAIAGAAGPFAAIVASVAASLLGSAASSAPTDADPLQSTYESINNTIDATFSDQAIAQVTVPANILTDPGKLQIYWALSGTTWKVSLDTSAAQSAYEGVDRTSMYAQLLPAVYSIAVIPVPDTINPDRPFYLTNSGGPQPTVNYFGGSNPDSYHDTTVDGVRYIYALYVNNRTFQLFFNPFVAGTALTDDLFQPGNLGIAKDDLLSGFGPWSKIPRIVFPNGYQPGS
jgi:hypothetical protein